MRLPGIRSDLALALAFAAFALAAYLPMFALMHRRFAQNEPKRFAAPAYTWSRACPQADYRRRRDVPRGCAARSYRLRSPMRLGLVGGGRGSYWYRLGDDAVALSCFAHLDRCGIGAIMPDKFHRPA